MFSRFFFNIFGVLIVDHDDDAWTWHACIHPKFGRVDLQTDVEREPRHRSSGALEM